MKIRATEAQHTNTSSPSAPKSRSQFATRLGSIAALAGALCAVGYVAQTVRHVATDSFVAPVVLSPDSDMVIQSKLSMSQLVGEQIRITTRRDEISEEIQAADQAITELTSLHVAAKKALEWTVTINAKQAHGNRRELHALGRQRAVLANMLTSHEALVAQMKKDMDAGLVSRMDHSREVQMLSQLRVAALENDRARIVGEVQLDQLALAKSAMNDAADERMWTPEMLMQRDQLVRVQCELVKLEAEKRAKTGERRHIEGELTKLAELIEQLKQRPVFRATERKTNAAFVPYTQIAGVTNGADVYECVWGIVRCTKVGRVTELLPGEAIVPDPWGTPARGQYAILELDEQEAAQSRTLRVRPKSTPIMGPAAHTNAPIAAR